MKKDRFIVILICVAFGLSVIFQLKGNENLSEKLAALVLPLITVLYFLSIKRKSILLSGFFIVYSISDLLIFIEPYTSYEFNYYVGNFLYLLAYTFLIFEIAKTINVNTVFKQYFIHFVVLLLLSSYLVYVLNYVLDPFMTAATEQYIEIAYNVVLVTVLSVALLNYLVNDNTKSLFFFFGALSIVFAEIIWVTLMYISNKNILHILVVSLHLLAYWFFYKQSKLFNIRYKEIGVKEEE
ncbi:MAG: hypothetical protein ACK5NB_01745 [Flavobacteriaceae bacterium]